MKNVTRLFAGAMIGAALMASIGTAMAADLGGYRGASTKDDYYERPVWSWTGFYAGINAGYVWGGNSDVDTIGQVQVNINNVNGGARPGRVGLDQEGFIGGAQIGYNWQSRGIVFGVEADISFTDRDDNLRVTTTALNGVSRLNNDFRSRLDYLGTVRGRVGVAFDRTLLFVTAGLAYGEVSNGADFFGPANQLQFTGQKSGVETGYVVGGGVEHAFSANWTLKGEYLYFDLGKQTVGVNVVPGSGGGGTGYDSRFENDGHILRAGLNYRF